MKFFLLLVAVCLTGSSLLPEASSIRTYYDNRVDSTATYYDNRVDSTATYYDESVDSRSTFASSHIFDVQEYGAVADGVTDSSNALLSAWNAACSSAQASTVTIPKGRTLVNPVSFAGPCKSPAITFQILGDVIAPTDSSLWNAQDQKYWIEFRNVDGLTITGDGTLDGQGASWWPQCQQSQNCQAGPASLQLIQNKNTVVNGISFLNGKHFHFAINLCDNVLAEGLTIQAPEDSPNTDGIHVASTNVILRNINIGTGDDCISMLEGSENIAIQSVNCGPGHGISIGSLGRYPTNGPVKNVTVDGVHFTGTMYGARIKTLAGGTGTAESIVFQNIQMDNVGSPILIDQNYCAGCAGPKSYQELAAGSGSGVQLTDVVFKNIKGTSKRPNAIVLACSQSVPCQGVQLEDVSLTSVTGAAQSVCQNIDGIVVQAVNPPIRAC